MVHDAATNRVGIAVMVAVLALTVGAALSSYWLHEWGLTVLHAALLLGLWIGIVWWIS
jgi:hypothetical protein